MNKSLLSLPSERFCSLLRKIKYVKRQHSKTRLISIKIAVVVGNGSSRRLAPDGFGAMALDPSGWGGGEGLVRMSENFVIV